MYALKRKVLIGGEYDEIWSADYTLKIAYRNQTFVSAVYDGSWHCEESQSEDVETFVRSSAYFSDKLEKYPAELLREVCGCEVKQLLPEELLRILLDDCALSLDKAVQILLELFGETLKSLSEKPWLKAIQPRTFALTRVLISALETSFFAIHDAYDEACHSPLGAIENGTSLRLSVFCSNASDVRLEVYGDDYYSCIPMECEGNIFSCTFTPESPAALWYRFKIDNKWLCPDYSGRRGIVSAMPSAGFRLTVYCRSFDTPDWFKGRVMYQIFPDRFGFMDDDTFARGLEYHRNLGQTPDGHKSILEPVKWRARSFEKDYAPDDFYGGNLKGIAKKLPYLKELGIGVIYLNPIVEARSNHRYDSSDYSRVDPILGINEDYAELCKKAEEMDIRIINDGVFSHTGADSVYFNRKNSYPEFGAYQGEASPYYKWYDFRSFPDDYRCWWNFKDLPEVNELDKSWQEFIITGPDSIVKRWLKLGASGWRLDVADELPDEVLSLIRQAAKEAKNDSLILGEVWEDAVIKESYGKRRNYALGYSLDSVMNYPLRYAVIDFALGKTDSFALRDFLMGQMMNYPKPLYLSLMNLLGSHDVERLNTALSIGQDLRSVPRERQLEMMGKISAEQRCKAIALQKLCAAIQYVIPGVPSLYYGDEESVEGGSDPFNRTPFEPQRKGLFDFYSKLGKVRNESAAIKTGELHIETPDPEVIILKRIAEGEETVCIVNRSEISYSHKDASLTPLLFGYYDTVPALSAEIYARNPKA